MCPMLDAGVQAFNERSLESFPFLIVEATMIEVREKGAVVPKVAFSYPASTRK
ncbi:MAG: transposase [Nitrospinota bacterium]